MDLKERLGAESWANFASSVNKKRSFNDSQQQQQQWQDNSIYNNIRTDSSFQQFFNQRTETQSFSPSNPNDQIKMMEGKDGQTNDPLQTSQIPDWDPRAMLSNLAFLEQKIHQLQDLVHLIVGRKGQVQGKPDEPAIQQQQHLVTTDLTSIIVQLISAAGSLLPSVKHTALTATPLIGQSGEVLFPSWAGMNGDGQSQITSGSKVDGATAPIGQSGGIVFPSGAGMNGDVQSQVTCGSKAADPLNQMEVTFKCGAEDHEFKDEEEIEEGDNLPMGSYEILQLEKEEILAPHTHFCTICGKGFKRDANLRMHMRGHGDEYKTAAALAKPNKESISEPAPIKRYSCPFAGCKRNKDHKKFQPLKTILCVKNHYKRTHCDKSYICSRCNTKKFSVIADLKTHEKHCGKDKWLCSCGTTFSRKDKLFGHIALFQGHTPAIPPEEMKVPSAKLDKGVENEVANKVSSTVCSFGSGVAAGNGDINMMDVKESGDDLGSCFSPLNFDTCNFGGFSEFPRPSFDDTESSFSFLISGNYSPKTGEDSGCNNNLP